MKPTGQSILLSGPIGAGKTTVAAEIRKLYPGPMARIEGDISWSFFDLGSHVKDKQSS